MGIFSSSWKYYAFAASTSVFEENDHPHTFQQVLLEGLRMDDTFANILAFTFRTDMYARARAMVRYATKDVDPYIRGLPSSDYQSFSVELPWVEGAILRDEKVPLIDFHWMKHGIFDTNFLVNKFIHDHYLDMNYFIWPVACLTPLLNPKFNEGDVDWTGTDYIINFTTRVAELQSSISNIYNDTVGLINPGETVHLRAVCDRGSDDPDDGQLGSLNLTFYNSGGTEISTETVVNDSGLNTDWQLLTLVATAPAGSVTVKAWAAAYLSALYITTAKWLGDSGLDNYYTIGNRVTPASRARGEC